VSDETSGTHDETSGNGLDAGLREFSRGQKLFGRYTLVKTLGRGGMGIVWLARDEELEREVALKFLPELIVHDRAVLSDLKRETRRSLELTHKNIVRIHDFVHDEQSGCISMEYVDGDTLSNLRADRLRKAFETDELVDWTSQLCDALDYAHNHARVVHRDLKPANLMVNQRGDLKVADFGIARSLSDSVSKLTMHQGKSGTLVYMSPQQLDGERGNHLDDIYSFGASIYELLTSRPPFSSGNVDRQIREKIPPSMAQRRKELEIEGDLIPEGWERVVASCLAKDPSRRPQSIANIADHLELATQKTRTRKTTPLPKKRRQSYSILAGGVGALCLLAASIWYFGFHRSARKPAPITTMVAEPNSGPEQSGMYIAGPPGVKINTTPAGATVTLGGLEEQRTPATISASPGKHALFVELDGYKPFARQVEVREGQLTDLGTITLKPNNGAIELATVPAGAKVFQNGDGVGVTPFRRENVPPGMTVFILVADGYLPRISEISVKPGETVKLNIPLEKPDEVYQGMIANSLVTIRFASDHTWGTMTTGESTWQLGENLLAAKNPRLTEPIQTTQRDAVKFAGSWSGSLLRAKTYGVESRPINVPWQPRSFVMRISDDGRVAAYRDEEKKISGTFVGVRVIQTITPPDQSITLSKLASTYKGTIHTQGNDHGVPLIIMLAADRTSGTMTQSSQHGDVVVKFHGVWDGTTLHAVTDEVISKPAGIMWEPESFSLRFADDGKSGTYEVHASGTSYVADLTSD
jgi:serine/threonine protein kinase